MEKTIFAIGIIFFVILSVITPMTFGNNVITADDELLAKNYNYDGVFLPEFYDCYNINELPDFIEYQNYDESTDHRSIESQGVINSDKTTQLLDGPMDSAWPMYCHDVMHSGRSPYSTADNPGFEKWRFKTTGWTDGSPVIDNEGNIYIGAKVLYALHPNGTLKWKYDIPHKSVHAPAIDEDGTIYFGTIEAMPNYLYAIYTINGSLKWKYNVGDHIWSSPAIGNDGTIFFGSSNHHVYALYPNGTLRWKYSTGNAVLSSPAIGDDGTIYCGSHSNRLFAFYPNNGTVKWTYKTGHWIRVSPCIGDDGTIYVVSLDNFLHAVNPDGSLKWKTNVGAGTSPTIGQDGSIYCGYSNLYSINPTNGSVKWSFNPGDNRLIRGSTPCNSIDGTIYFGTNIGEYDGGEIIAVYPNGTEKWRKRIASYWVDSAPAIGNDGTIYIGSAWAPSNGFLHAIGELDPNAPSAPIIDGETSGSIGTEYEYSLKTTSPLGRDVYYYVDWGDGSVKDWFGPFGSGGEAKAIHKWNTKGIFTIKARAKDADNLWGSWGEFQVTITRNKAININSLFHIYLERFEEFVEQFPNLFQVLRPL